MTLDDEIGLFVIPRLLSDDEITLINAQIRDYDVIDDPKCCVWKNSISLIDNPEMKAMCHDVCYGFGNGCDFAMYTPRGIAVVVDINTSQGNYD